MASYRVIYNPVSKDGKNKKYLPKVESLLRESGVDFELVPTQKPRHAIQLAKSAAQEGYSVVVAFGGDGTAHEVLNGAAKTNLSVGFIPTGNGNDLASALGYSSYDAEHAIRAITEGKKQKIPAVRFGNHYSFNILDIGISSIISRMALKRFRWIHGRSKYTFLAMRTIPFYKHPRTRLIIDGEEKILKLVLMAIGHGQTFGSGMNVLPYARFSDDLMTVCVVEDLGRMGMFRSFSLFTKGIHARLKEATFYKAKEIFVETDYPLPVEGEGEILGETPARIFQEQNAAKVIIPREWDLSYRSKSVLHLPEPPEADIIIPRFQTVKSSQHVTNEQKD